MKDLEFNSAIDVFGGTGSVAYRLKQEGKRVAYNDYLSCNSLIGKALIENKDITLGADDVDWLLGEHPEVNYLSFVHDNFADIYFTAEENKWIDKVICNIHCLGNEYKASIAFFALAQACIIKRPYNLFHRKNLYVRFADVERSFGNKTTWDKPFEEYFRKFVNEANDAVFDNGQDNASLNFDAFSAPNHFDLAYIDTPYIAGNGIGVDYHGFYHFLEGLTNYYAWDKHVDHGSKHKRLKPKYNIWNDKSHIADGFDKLFSRYSKSVLVVSYRSDGIPTENEIVDIMHRYKKTVQVFHFGTYRYVLSKNGNSKEVLIIGT